MTNTETATLSISRVESFPTTQRHWLAGAPIVQIDGNAYRAEFVDVDHMHGLSRIRRGVHMVRVTKNGAPFRNNRGSMWLWEIDGRHDRIVDDVFALLDTEAEQGDVTGDLVDDPGFGYGLQPTEHETPEEMVAHLTESGFAAGIEPGYGIVAYAIDGKALHGALEGTGWAATSLVMTGLPVPSMYVVERAYRLPPVGEFRTVCPTCRTSSGVGCATCRPDSVLGG